MEVQSLSIAVPSGCPNRCKFCVSCLHHEDFYNQLEQNRRFRDLYDRDYVDRLAYARDNGCNVMMYTGDGEPLMNMNFMERVANYNQLQLDKPFRCIELQTSGVTLDDEKLRWLRNKIRVSTISLSCSALDSAVNAENNQTPAKMIVDIANLCKEIKRYDFNLRLSLNLTEWFNRYIGNMDQLFRDCSDLGADQITFRVLYESEDEAHPVNAWIREHRAEEQVKVEAEAKIKSGECLERLPFGAYRYDVDGMSCVLDTDCMSTAVGKEVAKYYVLRANCRLSTRWNKKGSLIF